MKSNPNWFTEESLRERESYASLFSEWPLNAPPSEVSSFLREIGFDPDKELSNEIRQAISNNRLRADQIARRKSVLSNFCASYYSARSILGYLTILSALVCVNTIKLLSSTFYLGIFLCLAAIAFWASYVLMKHETCTKAVIRKALATVLLVMNLYGVYVFFVPQRAYNFQASVLNVSIQKLDFQLDLFKRIGTVVTPTLPKVFQRLRTNKPRSFRVAFVQGGIKVQDSIHIANSVLVDASDVPAAAQPSHLNQSFASDLSEYYGLDEEKMNGALLRLQLKTGSSVSRISENIVEHIELD